MVKYLSSILISVSAAFCLFSGQVDSQARFMQPVSRASAFRVPEYAPYNPPSNNDDHRINCGNVIQEEVVGGNCGVCGDAYSLPQPRNYEMGGTNYRGFFTGTYSSGGIIGTEVDIILNKGGYMEFRLCTTPLSNEDQDCFNQYVLQQVDGSGSRVYVTGLGATTVRTLFQLPAGVRCDHCVIQWNYRVANNWGDCKNGTQGIGCGAQETFRSCSDILII